MMIGLATPFMIIEPPDLKQQRADKKRLAQLNKQKKKKQNCISQGCSNLANYFKTIYKAFRENPKLFVGFLFVPFTYSGAVLITIFLLDWIEAKYDLTHPN